MPSDVESVLLDDCKPLSNISALLGAISSKAAKTTCLAMRLWNRFVLSAASSQGVTITWRTGLMSLEAKNKLSFSLEVLVPKSSPDGVVKL